MSSITIKVNMGIYDPVIISYEFSDESNDECVIILKYQILTLLPQSPSAEMFNFNNDTENFFLIDFAGRLLENFDDLMDLVYSSSITTKDSLPPVELWLVNTQQIDTAKFCTSNASSNSILQPSFNMIDMGMRLCGRCRLFLDSSLLKPEVAINTPIPSFTCQCQQIIELEMAFPGAKEQYEQEKSEYFRFDPEGPIFLFIKRKLLNDALVQQKQILNSNSFSNSDPVRQFNARIDSGIRTIMVYEDPLQQSLAREAIDFEQVHHYTMEFIEHKINNNEVIPSHEEAVIVGLMKWFKLDFFKWCNKPNCTNESCALKPSNIESLGGTEPNETERTVGWAGRVELYKCKECNQPVRFARFNNPAHLLTSRRGRCGEFANCFCLILRSLSFDARWVLDYTDHVWVEVWIPSLKRFVHVDPCERAFDSPVGYESGWNKKLLHVISFSRYGVDDAISRYSRKMEEVIIRRDGEIVKESFAKEIIATKDQEVENKFISSTYSNQVLDDLIAIQGISLLDRLRMGKVGFEMINSMNFSGPKVDISVDTMRERKRYNRKELEGLSLQTKHNLKLDEMRGRISGDEEWKRSRGEDGKVIANKDESKLINDQVACDTELCVTSPISEQIVEKRINHIPSPWMTKNMLCSSTVLRFGYLNIFISSYSKTSIRNRNPIYFYSSRGGNKHVLPSNDELIMIGNVVVCNSKNSNNNYGQRSCSIDKLTGCLTTCEALMNPSSLISTEKVEEYITFILDETQVKSNNNKSAITSVSIIFDQKEETILYHTLKNRIIQSKNESPIMPVIASNTPIIIINNGPSTSQESIILHDTTNDIVSYKQFDNNILEPNFHAPCFMRCRINNLDTVRTTGTVNHTVNHSYSIVNGFICSVPADIIYPTENESKELFLQRVETICSNNPYYLGFILMMSSDLLNTYVIMYSDNGYPLVQVNSNNCIAYLKCVDSRTSDNSHENKDGYDLHDDIYKYYYLGGGNHGDTNYFDSTRCLDSLTCFFGGLCDNNFQLSNIVLFAGDSLVNGIQLEYKISSDSSTTAVKSMFTTPLFSSQHDNPIKHSFELSENDSVSMISIKYGNLVDSVSIETKLGKKIKVGGNGGEFTATIRIPDNYNFHGFFGGTGGHLHNLGVILRINKKSQQSFKQSVSNIITLFDHYNHLYGLCQRCGLFDIGLLNHFQDITDHERHVDMGRLFELIVRIISNNSNEKAKGCFQAIATYLDNISK
eukprot:gene15916-21592_t